ncbi:MAG TPA: sulfite exporter TauE/SafE family protein [Flavobacteriaceae bacterium]|nr:sulfite exporter TauE/SafE family protein [Flavobacteriaceae bacterium]HPF11291.1 sulfite exporter TauE/SafE family protein [Flavobacteriaceae bacterium]HQU22217.1 sulfite exporter TauE/SafE family protein [Flavobacteriaceae bacterium]HQU64490.1 sulfite exporter TauE/SafE family protein [Flavobacteriaceae bacterium]HRW44621.1 sulfite exporter TauE/SafE family protein [Flavobacteriaceae bacterium]
MNFEILISLVAIGVLAGVFSGFMGVGGGVVMIPLLMLFLGYDQHQAQGMSLAVLAVPVTFVAAYTYHKSGYPIDWNYALTIAACFVVGGFIGSKLAVKIDQNLLKKIFAVVLVFAAVKLFFSK